MSVSSAAHVKSISLAPYPKPSGSSKGDKSVDEFRMIQRIVTNAREMRADHKIDPKLELESTLHLRDSLLPQTDLSVIENLAKLKIRQTLMDRTTDITPPFTLLMELESQPNGASRVRLEKDNARLEKVIESQSRQLNDETFVNKAPAHVVEGMRAKLAEYQVQLKKNRELLGSLE
jgi:valyl-tRNA synthetase